MAAMIVLGCSRCGCGRRPSASGSALSAASAAGAASWTVRLALPLAAALLPALAAASSVGGTEMPPAAGSCSAGVSCEAGAARDTTAGVASSQGASLEATRSFGAPPPDVWFNSWFSDPKVWAEVGPSFRKGDLVQIKRALREEAADALFEDLVGHRNWEAEVFNGSTMQFKRHNLACSRVDFHDCPRNLVAFHNHLGAALEEWSKLPLMRLAHWPPWPMATWYRPGDYISPHDDMVTNNSTGTRAISFILSMTRGWLPEWGGGFWWLPRGQAAEQHQPEFNTLYLFEPSPVSLHLVSPVTASAPDPLLHGEGADITRRRLTVSGWFTVQDPYHLAKVSDKYGFPPDFASTLPG
mmetsp:Transcript_84891/g.274435  ORF Transcript_84891/g.274435 Transcript_84891/m.274435 type:complete len:354 (+) Transcript_84891:255-1316(+)